MDKVTRFFVGMIKVLIIIIAVAVPLRIMFGGEKPLLRWKSPPVAAMPEGAAGREGYGGWRHHLHASPSLRWYEPGGRLEPLRKERYGEPPGMIRAVHQDELGFRGWADMPGDYEGSSASAVSAYALRSA